MAPSARAASMQASVDVVAGTPVRAVIASQRLRSLPMPSQLADVPFQAMASTFASASSSAAGSITEVSNWFSATASSAISVTRKREKCAVTPSTPASIALVTGSSTELEDGVIMPRRLRMIIPLRRRRPRLVPDQGQDPALRVVEGGARDVARTRQVEGEVVADAARTA